MTKISVIVPVFNEAGTIGEIIRRINNTGIVDEIIVVNDGSTDNTKQVLGTIAGIKLIHHNKNCGKGASIRTALKHVTGDVVIIQDADFEYDPAFYVKLVRPIIANECDIVYGSRFKGEQVQRFWHYVVNRVLTIASNMFTNINLSDMETGYKVFRKDVLSNLKIQSNRFGFEPEITAKVKHYKIIEIPITYNPRRTGKKIKWHDGVVALWCIFYYNIINSRIA